MNVIDLHFQIWQQLQARRDRLHHALLLAGPRGLGKLDLARLLAASLLCERRREDGSACGSCPACTWFAQGNHPDFRLLQPEALAEAEGESGGESEGKKASQQITIAQVRALDEFLHVGSHRHGLRVVLVHPAEAMNRSTANALLKTLEEPGEGTHFILVSHEAERLLPTIRSRCQTLAVPVPPADQARRWLVAAGVDDADRWLALAGGAPLLAEELSSTGDRPLLDALLDQLARGERIDALAAAAALDKLVKAIKTGAPAGRNGPPLKYVMGWAQKWLFDLNVAAAGQRPRYFVGEAGRIERLLPRCNRSRLLAFARKSLQYGRQSEHPLNSRLFLEAFFLDYAGVFERH